MAKTYYISFNGTGWSQFFPSNEPLITYERESDEIFLRYKVDEFIIDRNAGNESNYDTIETMFFNSPDFLNPLYFKIQKSSVDTYSFKSSVNEAKIDTQNGSFVISPEPDDGYSDILKEYKSEWGDRNDSGIFGMWSTIYYPTLDSGLFTNVDISSFADSGGSITWSDGGGAAAYARNILAAAPPINGIVYINISNFTGDQFTLRLVNSAFAAISIEADITADGVYALTQNATTTPVYVEILIDYPDPVSGTFDYEIYYPVGQVGAGVTYEALINKILTDASYMNLGYTVVSTFLWNDALGSDPPPNIDAYITANPTKDYVVEGVARYNDLFVTRVDHWTTTKSPALKVTLKDLMDYLKVYLRAWWFIDEDGNFRIEHEKYFTDYASQLDITALTSGPEVDAREMAYDKSSIFGTITHSGNNESNPDFISYPVIYDKIVTTGETKDVVVDSTTDVGYLYGSPDEADNSGIVIIAPTKSDNLNIIPIVKSIIETDAAYPNIYMSWSYLAANYWGYFGDSDSADINDGDSLSLDGVKRFLKQNNVSFYYSTQLDWKKPVTVTNGTGWIEKIEETESDFITLNLGFDPYL